VVGFSHSIETDSSTESVAGRDGSCTEDVIVGGGAAAGVTACCTGARGGVGFDIGLKYIYLLVIQVQMRNLLRNLGPGHTRRTGHLSSSRRSCDTLWWIGCLWGCVDGAQGVGSAWGLG
jgi:hypothetical protein